MCLRENRHIHSFHLKTRKKNNAEITHYAIQINLVD